MAPIGETGGGLVRLDQVDRLLYCNIPKFGCVRGTRAVSVHHFCRGEPVLQRSILKSEKLRGAIFAITLQLTQL